MLDIDTLTYKVETLYNRGDYASAKNLGDWYFGEYPDIFNARTAVSAWHFMVLSAERLRLSFFVPETAAISAAAPKPTDTPKPAVFPTAAPKPTDTPKPAVFPTAAPKPTDTPKPANTPTLSVTTRCDRGDPDRFLLVKLLSIIRPLCPVFNLIHGEISVALVGDEEEYKAVYKDAFSDAPLVRQYEDFQSCGFSNPGLHLLIFKEKMMNCGTEIELQNCPNLAILGMCAHEMAHFDVPDGTYKDNANPNEPETDAHVLSKGLAYSLYISRKTLGAACGMMSADEIKAYIAGIENSL